MDKVKILRIATVPISLKILTKGQLLFLNKNGFEIHCASADGNEIGDLFKNELIASHTIIPLKRTISPFSDLLAIYKCYILIKKLKPTIVHTYTPKAGLIGMIAAFLAGIKIRMHNVTGLPLMEAVGIKKIILTFVEKITYYFATNVYLNSFGIFEYVNKYIHKSDKIKVLGNGSTNGIDKEFFTKNETLEHEAIKLKNKLKIKETDFVWIFVGRLVKDKGINELLSAFTQLLATFPNIKLLLVGQFEEDLDPISKTSKDLIKNNKNIIYTGFIEDIRTYLMISNCLVFPSYREGLPSVPMQAACFNLPIIATDIIGSNEIVENGVNGILIKPKEINGLKDAMKLLYLDHNLQRKFSENTRQIVISKYRQFQVWQNLLLEYKKLLNV